jgi:hypothetical protein
MILALGRRRSKAERWRAATHDPLPARGLPIRSSTATRTRYASSIRQSGTRKAAGKPRATLSAADGAALAWHLRYWLGEAQLQPGYNMPRGTVRADFDF